MTVENSPSIAPDPIALELLRVQVLAIADEAGDTVERTSISPIVVESQDYGSVILGPTGTLVAGGGQALLHRVAATRAVKATIERYGDTIVDGDVYMSNDPHNGGGLHASDVMVQRPIFVDGSLVGWGVLSAHLMDMGGMAVGSWAPHATECYQEALRLPPVRLVKAGIEVSDVWDIFRTNIRFSDAVEMDVRSLMAATFVAQRKLQELVVPKGVETYLRQIDELVVTTAEEMLRRIRKIEPGVYRTTLWTEWGDEFVTIPCELTVSADGLHFDFTGAPEQIPFFINSKPFVVTALFLPLLSSLIAPDLPFNEGLIANVTLSCPEGSVVNCLPPAPSHCGHMHLGQTAAEAMNNCLRFAILASDRSDAVAQLAGFDCQSSHAPNSYWGVGTGGNLESWMMLDGNMVGQSASPGRDGVDFTVRPIDIPNRPSTQPIPLDVELYESWYPILMVDRTLLPGDYGAGQWRSGGSMEYRFKPWKTEEIGGSMLGYRGRIPLPGLAGGDPGRPTFFRLDRVDGSVAYPAMNAFGVTVREGDTFTVQASSGGGWGDPLDRAPGAVAVDVAEGRLSPDQARTTYGVVLAGEDVDDAATHEVRTSLRRQRLIDAEPPVTPFTDSALAEKISGATRPLAAGVVQRDNVAFAERSGAPLAVAPAHWTDGCPRLVEDDPAKPVVLTKYLDPITGTVLHADLVPRGWGRSFATLPDRWVNATA
ncbi:MAG: hydantoinase B/oxoprolinase family protein [Pseudonocardia sp.]|nr:MAG: hydantoinase B/oxoprolinase family protein [Pseudonocardia sp.]